MRSSEDHESLTKIRRLELKNSFEKAVPARNDIKVFNISFGPRGPIADDSLSRFTYVLDSLAANHKVAFFVPVGNDGGVANFNRIQSPSDLVNGIGVGAFTMSGDRPVHAPYSCRGLGRECGKIKPDVAAFGGCENRRNGARENTRKWCALVRFGALWCAIY